MKSITSNQLDENVEILDAVLRGSPEHTLAKKLLERRLNTETIQIFDIRPRRDGWQYPTPGGGLRWKNADSSKSTKYAWLDAKSEHATALYHADDLHQAVELAGGACWLAGGEPDVWALRSASIYHALSAFTEKAAPDNLAEYLQSLGVTVLYIAPDLDTTGGQWAVKIAEALELSGIELDCRQLPRDLGEGGDIGKAWQRYTKRLPFERFLLGLPRWYPVPDLGVQSSYKPNRPLDMPQNWGDIPKDYREKIARALKVEGFKSNGFSRNNVLCPFHPEDTPSAQLHETKGLFYFHDFTMHKWLEVGEALNLGMFQHTRETTDYITNTIQQQQCLGIVGLSVEVQAELIKLGFTALARLLDILYSQGCEGGETFTKASLTPVCLEHGLTAYALRKGLMQLSGKHSNDNRNNNIYKHKLQRARDNFCCFLSPLSFKQNEGSINNINSKKGRKEKVYRLPTRDEMAGALGVEAKTYQAIKPEKLTNAADYRAEVYAAKPRRKPGDYPRVQLTDPLGISKTTARAYDKRAGLKVSANFKREFLTQTEIKNMPKDGEELSDMRKQGKIKGAIWLEAEKPNSARVRFAPCQESATLALNFAGERGKVYKVTQLANTYKPKRSK